MKKDWLKLHAICDAANSEEVDAWFEATLVQLRKIESNIYSLSKKHTGTRNLEYLIDIVKSAIHHTYLSLDELYRKVKDFEKTRYYIKDLEDIINQQEK